jgi:hypothetical protein
VVVAAGAGHGQPEERGARGVDAIEDVLNARFLRDAAALAVVGVIAVKRRRQPLIARRIGQQVAGQLPGGELVVRQVRIQCPHDPIAPRPHRARRVSLVAVGVRVARQIEPFPDHVLAVARAGEEAVDDLLERLG